jgi:membrane protease YdiL (CAAX protease family)
MQDPQQRLPIFWLGVLVEGGLGALAWGLGCLLDEPILERLWWDAGDAALGIAVCLPMLAAFWLCLRLPAAPLVRIRKLVQEVIRPLFAGCTLIELAVLSLLAGAGEEMFFRGLLQGGLGHWLEPWAALAAASVVFGFLHAITPAYLVLATFLGGYLGAVWLATGNLLVVIVAHAVYDFVALVYLVRGPQG